MVRKAIDQLVAEGEPLAAITQSQLRMRLGGGSWQTLRDELDRARSQAAVEAPKGPARALVEQVPDDLKALATRIDGLLAMAGQEMTDLVRALCTAHAAERHAHEQEVQRLEAEIDRLARALATLERSGGASAGDDDNRRRARKRQPTKAD